jgi:predicted HicB family RNase H-like nuclease
MTPTTTERTVQIGVRLPESLHAAAKVAAVRRRTTLMALVAEAVRRAIESEKERAD